MPAYVLICEDCSFQRGEFVSTMAEREKMTCTNCGSSNLTNDYSRQRTSNFQLKGGGWPGKQGSLEAAILRERNKD